MCIRDRAIARRIPEKGLQLSILPSLHKTKGQDKLLPVSYTHLDVYKRQVVVIIGPSDRSTEQNALFGECDCFDLSLFSCKTQGKLLGFLFQKSFSVQKFPNGFINQCFSLFDQRRKKSSRRPLLVTDDLFNGCLLYTSRCV